MKAVLVESYNGPEGLVCGDAPKPRPWESQVLVRVHAAGVTPDELYWPGTRRDTFGAARMLPVIPGHELSGVVAETGPGVTGTAVGDEVYGLIAFTRDGAQAEYTIALPSELAPKPNSSNHVEAAAVPLGALTAWQALFDHGGLSAGQSILIHGGAGGVGTIAVQLAHWAGARVVTTCSATDMDFLRELGADEAIDYAGTRFEEVVGEMDMVIDTVGGATMERSLTVLKKQGILVSVAGVPSREQAATRGVRANFFIVRPDRDQLCKITELIDSGLLKPIVQKVFPLSEACLAYEQGRDTHTRGRRVVLVAD